MNTYNRCICSQNGQVEKKFITSFRVKSSYRAETKKGANEAACLSHKTSTTPAALLVVSKICFNNSSSQRFSRQVAHFMTQGVLMC